MVNINTGSVVLAVLLRFFYNFILLFNLHPLPIHLGAQILDFLDAKIMDITDDDPLHLTYQRLDKMSDTFYLLAVMIWLLIYRKKLWYWKVFVPILIFRIWGNIVFIIIGIRFTLVIFPDLFTWFYAIVTLYDLAKADNFFRKPVNLLIILITDVIFIVWAEIGHHGGNPSVNVGLDLTVIILIFVGIWLFVLAIVKRKKGFAYVWDKFKTEKQIKDSINKKFLF